MSTSAQFNFERAKYYDEVKRREAERAHDQDEALLKQVNDAGTRDAQAAIRALLVLNGGSVAALLAFTAGLAGRTKIPLPAIGQMAANLKWFAYGLVAAGITAAVSYFTNSCYAAAANTRPRSWIYPYIERNAATSKAWLLAAYVFHGLGVLSGLLGLVLFIYGLHKVQQRLGPLFVQP
jgi:hypothetical protein